MLFPVGDDLVGGKVEVNPTVVDMSIPFDPTDQFKIQNVSTACVVIPATSTKLSKQVSENHHPNLTREAILQNMESCKKLPPKEGFQNSNEEFFDFESTVIGSLEDDQPDQDLSSPGASFPKPEGLGQEQHESVPRDSKTRVGSSFDLSSDFLSKGQLVKEQKKDPDVL